jgi:hypothetical protein
MDPADPPERELDSYFFYAFRYAAGCALQRAAMLQTRCRLAVVSDEAEIDTLAGTNRAFADWRALGRPFDLISYPHERAKRKMSEEPANSFRAVVFLWDGAPNGKDRKSALDKLFKAAGKGHERVDRTHRDGRRGTCLIANSTEEALVVAMGAAEAARQAKHSLRVICDFGAVLGGDLDPDKKLIARLRSADDLPGLALDCVLATEAYAAQAKFDLGDRVMLVPVGRAESLAPGEDNERQALRSRPSLPIYTAAWARAKQGL